MQLRIGERPTVKVEPQEYDPYPGKWYFAVRLAVPRGGVASVREARIDREIAESWRPLSRVEQGRVVWTGFEWKGNAANREDAVNRTRSAYQQYIATKRSSLDPR